MLVMDNLNTHKLASLYEAFTPDEARRIAKRLEIHYTPKHGRWLDMAEIEIGVLSRQCLDRRIADQDTLRTEINAWQKQRNQKNDMRKLALYHRRCTNKIEITIPVNTTLTDQLVITR